jgi:single-strand DNA-binding protein
MSSLNKVMLIGNLGKDPEIRNTQAGDPIANFSVATSESWKDKQSGEKKEKTEWHNVVVFNPSLAKICGDYLKKGSKVYVEGAMKTRKWTDKDGNDRYSTEVVLDRFNGVMKMLSKRDGESPRQDDGGGSSESSYGPAPDLDDEIPF